MAEMPRLHFWVELLIEDSFLLISFDGRGRRRRGKSDGFVHLAVRDHARFQHGVPLKEGGEEKVIIIIIYIVEVLV